MVSVQMTGLAIKDSCEGVSVVQKIQAILVRRSGIRYNNFLLCMSAYFWCFVASDRVYAPHWLPPLVRMPLQFAVLNGFITGFSKLFWSWSHLNLFFFMFKISIPWWKMKGRYQRIPDSPSPVIDCDRDECHGCRISRSAKVNASMPSNIGEDI